MKASTCFILGLSILSLSTLAFAGSSDSTGMGDVVATNVAIGQMHVRSAEADDLNYRIKADLTCTKDSLSVNAGDAFDAVTSPLTTWGIQILNKIPLFAPDRESRADVRSDQKKQEAIEEKLIDQSCVDARQTVQVYDDHLACAKVELEQAQTAEKAYEAVHSGSTQP